MKLFKINISLSVNINEEKTVEIFQDSESDELELDELEEPDDESELDDDEEDKEDDEPDRDRFDFLFVSLFGFDCITTTDDNCFFFFSLVSSSELLYI